MKLRCRNGIRELLVGLRDSVHLSPQLLPKVPVVGLLDMQRSLTQSRRPRVAHLTITRVTNLRVFRPKPRKKEAKAGAKKRDGEDSDEEMKEVGRSSSRSVTPAPPVKKRKVEGKRVTTLADSDDEME